MIDKKDVTIIIPHLGATEEQEYSLNECVKSLEGFDGQIILAHNGINDCRHKGVSAIHISHQGQCKSVNAAVAISSTPWVLVTNDDMIYASGWFEKLTWVIEKNGKYIKCVSPKLIEPNPGAPTFEVQKLGGAGGDFQKDKWLEFAENYKGTDLRTGFNLPFLINRELWDIIGGYDVNFDPWGSNGDSDLEYKIRLAGVQPMQNTNCIVYHFSQTSGTFLPENQSYWQKNWDYFIQKWGFPRTDDGIWEATFDIPKPPVRKFTPFWENFYGNKS